MFAVHFLSAPFRRGNQKQKTDPDSADMPSSNPWNAFEHAAKQAGITSAGDMALVQQLYGRLRASPGSIGKWNSMEHAVTKGLGLSQKQVSALYHASKGIKFAATPAPVTGDATSNNKKTPAASDVADASVTPPAAASELASAFKKLAVAETAAASPANPEPVPADSMKPQPAEAPLPVAPASAIIATTTTTTTEPQTKEKDDELRKKAEQEEPAQQREETEAAASATDATCAAAAAAVDAFDEPDGALTGGGPPVKPAVKAAAFVHPANSWNAFEHAAKQAGLPAAPGKPGKKLLRQLYGRLRASPGCLLGPEWNEFESVVAGLGLTKQEVSALYRATKGIAFATAPPPAAEQEEEEEEEGEEEGEEGEAAEEPQPAAVVNADANKHVDRCSKHDDAAGGEAGVVVA